MTSPDPQPTEADKVLLTDLLFAFAGKHSGAQALALIARHAQQAREEERERRGGPLVEALERCAQIVERNLYRQHEKVEDVPKIARAALSKKEDGQ